jgi:hypothetical protein
MVEGELDQLSTEQEVLTAVAMRGAIKGYRRQDGGSKDARPLGQLGTEQVDALAYLRMVPSRLQVPGWRAEENQAPRSA